VPAVMGRGGNSDEAVPRRDEELTVRLTSCGFGSGEGIAEANCRRASSYSVARSTKVRVHVSVWERLKREGRESHVYLLRSRAGSVS
jgi:hypothetical protein